MIQNRWLKAVVGALCGYLVPGYYEWLQGERKKTFVLLAILIFAYPALMLVASFGSARELVNAYFAGVTGLILIILVCIFRTARAAYRNPQALKLFTAQRIAGGLGYWAVLSVCLFAGIIQVREHLLEPFYSPTTSQQPSILQGDRFLADKRKDRVVRELKAGDVIVFRSPQDPNVTYVKRVVGMAGETVEKTLVPPNTVYVMGDDRNNSFDSRHYGPVPLENIRGKALMVWFSLDPKDSRIRTERVGKWIE